MALIPNCAAGPLSVPALRLTTINQPQGNYEAAKVKSLASRSMMAGTVQSDPYLAFHKVVNGWYPNAS